MSDNTMILVVLIITVIGLAFVAVHRANEADKLRLQLQECHAGSTY